MSTDATTDRADVVIIGGGAMGAATAFHLGRLGITDVVLVERDTLASGSTSKSAGGVRLQFADELNIGIMRRAMPEFEQFDAMIGEHCDYVPDIGFHQYGYLFLLTQDDQLPVFRAATALQRSMGIPTQELTGAEAQRIVPGLVVDDVLLATFCEREGHCSPESVVLGYAAAARAMGARVYQNRSVTGIRHTNGRISAVETTQGTIATNTVICAAGVWSPAVAAMVGVDIPVHGMKRHMWYSPESAGLPDRMPLTIDFASSFYAHREGQGLVFGGTEDSLEEMAEHAIRRLPSIAEVPIARTWWGYYEVSPDHNAIVGGVAGVERFYVATGFSGHGFQQAPAVGEHLAQLVAGVTPTLDLAALDLSRFDRGALRNEHYVI